MKTFEIRNGDLALGPGGFATVTGAAKVKQDLGIALREPFRSDRFHPRWGSILPSFIGRQADDHTKMLIQSEAERAVSNYMVLQADQIKRDADNGRKPRYGQNEIVSEIGQVDVRQTFDRFSVRVVLRTLSGDQITLVRTVEG